MSDITRSEAIDVIELIMRKYEEDECICCDITLGDEDYEALRLARDSLKTDEAYQLEYESTTKKDLGVDKPAIIDWNNCHTPEQLESISTTKNDLLHCQHTDEEIAKSFVEDVEAVKDLLPTTKNDLGVDCIDRADAIKAMQDKAKKLTNEDTINGLCGAVAILFDLPSVTPQESKSEWEQDHEILKAYSDGANEVLDKIRAEINTMPCAVTSMKEIYVNRDKVINILDKYKAESERK